jgi:hypothetical protein
VTPGDLRECASIELVENRPVVPGTADDVAIVHLATVHALDDADRVCTACGGELQLWEGQSEDSEEIESIQGCFIRVLH